MKFTETRIDGAFFIDIEPFVDQRGLFARSFCREEFAGRRLETEFVQCNLSHNVARGTLRGMHYQLAPHAEAKLVRATHGRVFDVAVDLRRSSPTYLAWDAVELDWRRRNAFYIPPGCAHGYLTLEDDCEVFYQVSASYAPDLAREVRWDDPAFGITWPFVPSVVSDKDANCADYEETGTAP